MPSKLASPRSYSDTHPLPTGLGLWVRNPDSGLEPLSVNEAASGSLSTISQMVEDIPYNVSPRQLSTVPEGLVPDSLSDQPVAVEMTPLTRKRLSLYAKLEDIWKGPSQGAGTPDGMIPFNSSSVNMNVRRLRRDSESPTEDDSVVAISYEPLKFIARSRLFNKVSGDVWICDWRTASLYPAANGRVSSQPVETYPGEETSMPTDRRLVIVKTFNTRSIDPHLTELIALSELKHRHISQIYDVFVGYDTSDVYVISEYAEGNLRSLIDTQNGRPLSLPVISSIFVQLANAIHHVHSLGWMHRNICPESVMVTPQGVGTYKTAKEVPLSDWDPVYLIQLANFEDCHYVDTYRSAPHRHGCKSHWYDAPEVLLSEERHSRAMDMWSLGALLVELVNLKPLFPGSGPFMQLYGLQSLLGGFEPDETTSESELHGGGTWQEGLDLSSHELPVLLTHKLRPKPMDELFHREVPLSMMKLTAQLLRYDPELRMTSAQCLDHPFTVDEFFKPLRLSVADLTGKVVKLGPFPIGYGGYGEVWRGKLHADDGSFQEVAIKLMKTVFPDELSRIKVRKRIHREMTVWHQLSHQNVVPLLGFASHLDPIGALVSPWFANGNAREYVRKHDASLQFRDRLTLVRDIAEGMFYLHSLHNPIVHGDLRADNVLITDDGVACIADFGLGRAIRESVEDEGFSNNSKSNTRWSAPELLFPPDDEDPVKSTVESDVYAFACTSLEIITGKIPYAHRKNPRSIYADVFNKCMPFTRDMSADLSPALWDLFHCCWSAELRRRPSMAQILASM